MLDELERIIEDSEVGPLAKKRSAGRRERKAGGSSEGRMQNKCPEWLLCSGEAPPRAPPRKKDSNRRGKALTSIKHAGRAAGAKRASGWFLLPPLAVTSTFPISLSLSHSPLPLFAHRLQITKEDDNLWPMPDQVGRQVWPVWPVTIFFPLQPSINLSSV